MESGREDESDTNYFRTFGLADFPTKSTSVRRKQRIIELLQLST